mmetsp:Transcript_42420/g.83343  ORF Transcript_42420/g.83343 Transcript_42420/m.83343 type:complete len:143 (+) Transcript_42420:106-534(+)
MERQQLDQKFIVQRSTWLFDWNRNFECDGRSSWTVGTGELFCHRGGTTTARPRFLSEPGRKFSRDDNWNMFSSIIFTVLGITICLIFVLKNASTPKAFSYAEGSNATNNFSISLISFATTSARFCGLMERNVTGATEGRLAA